MQDMNPKDVKGEFRELTVQYFDGSKRTILVNDVEVLYPEGRLIVSRTDKDGVITHVNKSFIEMSGYSEQELVGVPHHILRHPDMPPAAFKGLWDTVHSGKRWQGYVKNLRKDGAYYWVYATVVANIRNGEVTGYTSVRRKPSRKKVQECAALYPTLF